MDGSGLSDYDAPMPDVKIADAKSLQEAFDIAEATLSAMDDKFRKNVLTGAAEIIRGMKKDMAKEKRAECIKAFENGVEWGKLYASGSISYIKNPYA